VQRCGNKANRVSEVHKFISMFSVKTSHMSSSDYCNIMKKSKQISTFVAYPRQNKQCIRI
jgi:hypothetical protein